MGRKRVDSEVYFYPSFPPNPRTGGRKSVYVEIVKNGVLSTWTSQILENPNTDIHFEDIWKMLYQLNRLTYQII